MIKIPYVEQTSLMTDHYAVNKFFMNRIIEAKRSVKVEAKSLPDSPTDLTRDEAKLRLTLLVEEVLEAIDAAGFELNYDGDGKLVVEPVEGKSFNLVEFVDACADIDVINTGSLIQCGVPDVLVKEFVNVNNIEKFGPGHTIREDGKLVKPPNHPKPKFAELLEFLKNPPSVIKYVLDGQSHYADMTKHGVHHGDNLQISMYDIARSVVYECGVEIKNDWNGKHTFRVTKRLYGHPG